MKVLGMGRPRPGRVEQRAAAGLAVRYLRSILVPGDETCLHLVEASSAEMAARLCRLAELPFIRVADGRGGRRPAISAGVLRNLMSERS
jgi:hypothetical protein